MNRLDTPRDLTDHATQRASQRQRILAYLRDHLPGYPFDETVDTAFVDELIDDFPHLDILDQLKALRWYADNRPFDGGPRPRLAVRRWLARAW